MNKQSYPIVDSFFFISSYNYVAEKANLIMHSKKKGVG